MSDNPFAKYRTDAAPAETNPFSRYVQSAVAGPAPADNKTSVGEALWGGLLHGAGNIAWGAGRLGARMMPPDEAAGAPMSVEQVDRGAADRATAFEKSPAVREHPTASATGEVVGEMGATAPLSAITGGSSAVARALWGALTGAGGGALGAASSAPPESFGRSVAAGAGLGGLVGAGAGGAGALARPPVLERPMMTGQPVGSQPGAPAPPPRPMLALPPPTIGVAGQPATPTGANPQQMGQLSALAAMKLLQEGGNNSALRGAVEGARPQGMLPPGPTSTMVRDQPPGSPMPAAPPAAIPRQPGPPPPKNWTEAARMLDRAGVRLSPGQARNMSEMERTLQTWPILRGFVRGQVGRSVDDFDRAVVQQSLAPIGGTVPRSVRAGHDLMDFAAKRFDEAYNPLLPQLRLNREGVVRALENNPEMSAFVSGMSEDHIRRLMNLVNGFVSRFDDRGMMNGQIFKRAESDMAHRAFSLAGGNDDELSTALRRTLSVLRNELATQNPQFGNELQQINHAFSLFAEARAAANRDASSGGRFTPRDLLHTVRSGASDDSFSRGNAPLQAFAEAGEEVIGPSLASRRPELSRSAARVLGDTAAGATLTPAYLAAGAAQQVPGLGRGIGAVGPGAAADVGRRSAERRRRGPLGGIITNQSSYQNQP